MFCTQLAYSFIIQLYITEYWEWSFCGWGHFAFHFWVTELMGKIHIKVWAQSKGLIRSTLWSPQIWYTVSCVWKYIIFSASQFYVFVYPWCKTKKTYKAL